MEINLDAPVIVDTPDAWKHALDGETVAVLPLVDNLDRRYPAGWCVYTYEHVQAPELEIICGGINTKTPLASAIWRQGNLLHFGFEQSPAELNDNGRALLVNSICYIARFTEDRPLVRTPSPFYSGLRLLDRGVLDRLAQRSDRDLDDYLDWYLDSGTREDVRGLSRDALAEWYHENRGFLRADERGKFVMDQQFRELGVAVDSHDFIPTAIAVWQEDRPRAMLAQQLLERYAGGPEAAEDIASPEAWMRWWHTNRDYLFFTDTGGFRWQVDLLAKQRGVPTHSLRGAARATRSPIGSAGP